MNDASPRVIATHYGIASALSFSAIAAPFVPEAILAYAGYRYLRHFLYGWRLWRAPARVPLHLGRRGYRDATTRRRGDATWPIGLAAPGQVWLRREDLVQGLSLHGDDPEWQARAIGALVFGACLNRMGAIVVQGATGPSLTPHLTEVAEPFGRDNEIVSLHLRDVAPRPLRIAASTLAAAIADLRLGPEAGALNQALLPILEMLGARYRKNPLSLYKAFVDEKALSLLVDGRYEIDDQSVDAGSSASADAAALDAVLRPLKAIPDERREVGRRALAEHAAELSSLASVSLTEGFELRDAVSTGGLVCIRPTSPLTAALVIARCVEVLAAEEPGEAARTLVHLVYPDALSGGSAKRFRAAATRAGAIGSLSVTARPPSHISKATRKLCAVRIDGQAGGGDATNCSGKIASTIKDCLFVLDIQLPSSVETTNSKERTITGDPENTLESRVNDDSR